MKNYIWFKNNKIHMESMDETRKCPHVIHTSSTTKIYYDYDYVNGGLFCEKYYKNDNPHREGDKPAWIRYFKDGTVEYEDYRKDGMPYSGGGKPAYVGYWETGNLRVEQYYQNGTRTRRIEYSKRNSGEIANVVHYDKEGEPIMEKYGFMEMCENI